MPAFSQPPTPFQIGAWSLDPSTGELTRGTEVRRARRLVTDVLLYLVARPGEVVTKEELIAGPWCGAVVADSALTSTIAELRDLLDDQPKAPRYIETLPKRGYRLIADITVPEPAPALAPPPSVGEPEAPGRTLESSTPSEPATMAAGGETRLVAAPWWSRHTRTLAFALGMAVALGAIASIAWRLRPVESASMRPMRLTVDLPEGVKLAPDSVPRIALTADGSRMAYVVRTEAGTAVYTRTLDQFEAHPVTGTDTAVAPFFSHDGSRIGFFAGGELRSVPVTGGEPRIVCPARIALGASWGSDDTIVFSGARNLGLFEVPAMGGEPRELTAPDHSRGERSHRWPQVLPDGVHVLFTALGRDGADALIVSRQTGERHVVVEDANTAMFVAPDRIVFERTGRLLVTTIDATRFEVTGPERVVAEDAAIAGPGFGSPVFAVASGGALVYVPIDPRDTERELVWVDRSGTVSTVDAPRKSYMHPRLSADGRQILTWLRTEDPDLWLFDLTSRALTRVPTGIAARRAAWSPDGRRVIFDGPAHDNRVTLYAADLHGGIAQRLRPEQHSQYAGTWTPDGRTIAYVDLTTNAGFDIVTMADALGASATPVLSGPANETAPAFAPDGRWLAFASDVSGRNEVYLVSYPQIGPPIRVSTDGGREPVWSRRGDELFFRQGQSMYAVQVTGTTGPRLSEPTLLFTGDFDQRPAFHPSYDVAPDGRFLMIRGTAPSTTDTRIAVLLRWDTP